jgi:hypothetical protein
MGQVTSSYISSVVVQPGVSSFTFTPSLRNSFRFKLLFKRNRNVFSYYFLKFTWPPNILFVYYYYKQIKIKVMLSREKIIKTVKISSIGILIGAYFMTGLYGLAFVAGLIVGEMIGDKIFKD